MTIKSRLFCLQILYFLLLTAPARADQWREKVALITGASSGIGAALAREAAARGMKLVLVDIAPQGAEHLARSLSVETLIVKADLAEAPERARALKEARARFGRVDALFNNAGYGYMASVEEWELAGARRQFDVNYWAYVELAAAVYPEMKKRGSGLIVSVASLMGMMDGFDRNAMYAASKHAVVGWGRTVAPEFQRAGIRFMIVCPAGVKTNFLDNLKGKGAKTVQDRLGGAVDDFDDADSVAADIFAGAATKKLFIFPGSAPEMMPEGLAAFFE